MANLSWSAQDLTITLYGLTVGRAQSFSWSLSKNSTPIIAIGNAWPVEIRGQARESRLTLQLIPSGNAYLSVIAFSDENAPIEASASISNGSTSMFIICSNMSLVDDTLSFNAGEWGREDINLIGRETWVDVY